MLVLSRKVGQELVIGDNVRITVNRISGSRVTLGISAPADVRIVRGELEPIVRSFELDVESTSESSGEGREACDEVEGIPYSAAWHVHSQMPLIDISRHVP